MQRDEQMVGVRELRAHLSAYLRAVSRGVTVTVGDRRRRPVARLVPVARSRDEDALERLAAEGKLRRGIGKPGSGRRVKPRRASPTIAERVLEDRR